MKIGIQALLWILCVFFAYKIYDSINGPIAFNNTKTERYAKVISKLKDIGNAQAAHKNVLGYFIKLLSAVCGLYLKHGFEKTFIYGSTG